jgi:hypothetical protein
MGARRSHLYCPPLGSVSRQCDFHDGEISGRSAEEMDAELFELLQMWGGGPSGSQYEFCHVYIVTLSSAFRGRRVLGRVLSGRKLPKHQVLLSGGKQPIEKHDEQKRNRYKYSVKVIILVINPSNCSRNAGM